ncbi:hypothetical protein ABT158_50450 [Nonomuraea sp. NPDC001636]|uniref:hypothetical protein n=1 Tax=Nonomuraea sp. NPDC001636 TaxID=3154391 RepID=UPI0033325844
MTETRAQAAADLGWHPDTYRMWEIAGRADDKMSGEPAWLADPDRPGRSRWLATSFFTGVEEPADSHWR